MGGAFQMIGGPADGRMVAVSDVDRPYRYAALTEDATRVCPATEGEKIPPPAVRYAVYRFDHARFALVFDGYEPG